MNKRKVLMFVIGSVGAIGIFLPYVETIIYKEIPSLFIIIGTMLVMASKYLRQFFHRGDIIQKKFEKLTEENKTKVFNYVIEIEKEQKMKLSVSNKDKEKITIK